MPAEIADDQHGSICSAGPGLLVNEIKMTKHERRIPHILITGQQQNALWSRSIPSTQHLNFPPSFSHPITQIIGMHIAQFEFDSWYQPDQQNIHTGALGGYRGGPLTSKSGDPPPHFLGKICILKYNKKFVVVLPSFKSTLCTCMKIFMQPCLGICCLFYYSRITELSRQPYFVHF